MKFWIKKYWHLFFGSLALVTAIIILFFYNNSADDFWIKLLQSIYFSITLILLEGGNFAFPNHAPLSIKIILWVCYFAAPLLTLTFILRYIQERFFNRIPRRLKNHIIICGMGRNGKIIYELASETYPKKRFVIIEKDESNAYGDELEKHSKTWWLKKDFSELSVLQEARAEHAHKIYITTNHDLANITTLMNALEVSQDTCEINCHIGEIQLYNNVEKVFSLEKAKADKKRLTDVRLFNGYRVTTRRLFENKIFKKDKVSADGNIYIFFGFGRFGQMLYNHIIDFHFNKDHDFAVIVSLNNSLLNDPRNYTWSKDKVSQGIKPSCLIGDMNDFSVWDSVVNLINEDPANKEKPVHLFNCRDSDIANINLAISLKTNGPELLRQGTVYCRTYGSTSDDLENILDHSLTPGKSSDVVLFPVYTHLEEAFNDELFANEKTPWSYEDFLTYLLLYAANADMQVTEDEKNMLFSKVKFNEHEHIFKEFEKENDYNRLQKIQSFRDAYYNDEASQEKLLRDLKDMFLADDKYDSTEKAIFVGLRRILK